MKKLTLIFFLLVLFAGCNRRQEYISPVTAFTGATIIDGTGLGPIKDGVLLVRNGRVVESGIKSVVTIPVGTEIVDVSGKFIMPGIINAHGHGGAVKGNEWRK